MSIVIKSFEGPPMRLERIDPSKRMARYYEMSLARTLFGEVAVVREWGRIGASRQRFEQWHPNEISARAALEALGAIKRRRGYHSA